MTNPSTRVSIDRDDPAFRAAVTAALDARATQIRQHAADQIDTEATRLRDCGHNIEHLAGWREAAQWLREHARTADLP